MSDKKYVYRFGGETAEGDATMHDLLGGKGANLAEMAQLGLPVPPGFTITTDVCHVFLETSHLPDECVGQIEQSLTLLEETTQKNFGNEKNPLLVSVRSGASVSMPGMMETILNVGLNDRTVKGLAKSSNPRFAYDCYRRLIQMYGNIVLQIDKKCFAEIMHRECEAEKIEDENELSFEGLCRAVKNFKTLVKQTGKPFPQDPHMQLTNSIEAVFRSWNNPHAAAYRRNNNIPENLGTAVTVQQMVFGNLNERSGTGVFFTRDKNTGEKSPIGEWRTCGQGEDVVAGGMRTQTLDEFAEKHPELFRELRGIGARLERHFKDMQDIEFTVENGNLYILQARAAKRSPSAQVKVVVDLVKEMLITVEDAILRNNAIDLEKILYPSVDIEKAGNALVAGVAAAPGAVSGVVVFTAQAAIASKGQKTILVRQETAVEDYEGMAAAEGILTARGGPTSHAALVASEMGKPAVVGAKIEINEKKGCFSVGGITVYEGDLLTVDGSNGLVFQGETPLLDPNPPEEFTTLLAWARRLKTLGIRVNADDGHAAKSARELGAEGVGLARTEHMFTTQERLSALQTLILSEIPEERNEALEKILQFQTEDFFELLTHMEGNPVCIRLLDPPLHEFLPRPETLEERIVVLLKTRRLEEMKILESFLAAVRARQEANPMSGHRGCRLGITNPELTRIQAKALANACAQVLKKGIKVNLEIMVPLVSVEKELTHQIAIIEEEFESVTAKWQDIRYTIGTMIETPRACFIAGKLAQHTKFFSFGTNDLTQFAFGMSRDDAHTFLPHYLEEGMIENDPFRTIDEEGVGKLIKIAIAQGKRVRPKLKIGVCGDHAGDPESITFFDSCGVDYISCRAQRIPTATVAAAQAAIKRKALK